MTDQLEMIDIHAHILPGIDDGARNWEETGRLLEAAWAQGVRHIMVLSELWVLCLKQVLKNTCFFFMQ